MDLIVGSEFNLVELETCRENDASRPRVRPVEPFDTSIKVEFPRKLRETNPIGTRFKADVVVCQKHNKEGKPIGKKYLRAITKTIIPVEDFTPSVIIMALQKTTSVSGRAYEYVDYSKKFIPSDLDHDLKRLRKQATEQSKDIVSPAQRKVLDRARNHKIKLYALVRSNGNCEACGDPAPFIRKSNGQPYLEVHHIKELSKGGADSPENVAAICPNCHRRVTHGHDAKVYNEIIMENIRKTESALEAQFK